MKPDDTIRLRHMLDAAREVIEFVRHKSRNDLDADRKLALALVKDIEIIGEAAKNVSAEGRAAHPGIPWGEIVGMRNVLIHEYSDIELDTVWQTAQEDIPALVAQLERILEPPTPPASEPGG